MKVLVKKMAAPVMMSGLLLSALMGVAHAEQAPQVTPKTVEVSPIELAYKKEFAFLEAQKRDLQERLTRLLEDSNAEFDAQKSSISKLENQVLASSQKVDLQKNLLLDAERVVQANEDNQEIFKATFMQADASLETYKQGLKADKSFQDLKDGEKVSELFDRAANLLVDLSSVKVKSGEFHILDGAKVSGDIVHFGNVARFGLASVDGDLQAGMLAPAGEGLFKLWAVNDATVGADTAKALLAGEQPETLDLFLIENTNVAVQEAKEKTVMDVLKSGGVIGYVIVAFGLAALIMVVARALFLRRANQSSQDVMNAVRPAITQGNINEAMEACREFDGATSRVVRATIRNLDRDREHIEDIVSESILHESEHLDRFGTTILVLAAVSPLMGLLGTVTGMIATFDVITEFGTGDPKMLSGGISEALVTTELGLIVAIPAVLLGNLLSGWAERIKNDMELGALHLINLFKDKEERAKKTEAA
ncbi:MAG: MotA/TolQ/ExbB proton channel family protein [Oceanospirillaceae bacterium]|nr:MotA/TolQ/ExbB proton channel family protein [Oceanospirillaceae bacterium]